MRLCSSVLLLQLCGDFLWWPPEYLNYCSLWPFVSISDLLRWVTPCAGSASRADVSAPWLKLLPLGPSYGTFWFKMYFSMITAEAQHLACLQILENDDWNERPHITASEATYEHLKMLCPKMWDLLGGKGLCCSFHHPCESLSMLGLTAGMKEGGSSLLPVHWQNKVYMEPASSFCCHWLSFTQRCIFLLKPYSCWLPVMNYLLFHQCKEEQP